MTANELADYITVNEIRTVTIDMVANMLRQQQAEIEALKLRELTDEKIWKLWQTHLNDEITVFARAIEKRIKNGN